MFRYITQVHPILQSSVSLFFVGKSLFCFTLASHSLIPGVLSSCKNGRDNGKRTGGSKMSNVQGASLRNLQRLQTVLKPQLVGGK